MPGCGTLGAERSMTASGLVLRKLVRACVLSCSAAACLCAHARSQSWVRLSGAFAGGDSQPVLVFDWQRQRVVVHASDGDMHDWDGNVWRRIQTPRASRRSGTALYDLAHGRLLHADDLGNISAWNGHAWSNLPGPAPHVVAWAFDLARLQVFALANLFHQLAKLASSVKVSNRHVVIDLPAGKFQHVSAVHFTYLC